MNSLLDPKDVTTKQAAEILLAHGWQVYPDALPYGEFFYIPCEKGWSFQVACLAYREFWHIEQQRLTMRSPDSGYAPVQLELFSPEMFTVSEGYPQPSRCG